MPRLDINPEGEKEGIIQAKPSIPKLKSPIKLGQITVIAFLAVAIFAVAAFLIFSANQTQKLRINSFEKKISTADQELANLKDLDQKSQALYGQVKNLQSLWSQRSLWSNAIQELAKTMTKNSKIDTISFDQGVIVMNGRTNSLSSLAKLITSLEQNNNFSQPQLTALGFAQGSVTFNLKMNFSPSLLAPAKE